MEIMGKCPFWGEPCLKEKCSAFQHISKNIWDNKGIDDYRSFKQEKVLFKDGKFKGELECLRAIGIPYCRVLGKELPMKKFIEFVEVQV